jgi:hypothetical protein
MSRLVKRSEQRKGSERGQVCCWLLIVSVLKVSIMSRPLRIEFPGAWYHIMNRGSRRENIFLNSKDYEPSSDCFRRQTKNGRSS